MCEVLIRIKGKVEHRKKVREAQNSKKGGAIISKYVLRKSPPYPQQFKNAMLEALDKFSRIRWHKNDIIVGKSLRITERIDRKLRSDEFTNLLSLTSRPSTPELGLPCSLRDSYTPPAIGFSPISERNEVVPQFNSRANQSNTFNIRPLAPSYEAYMQSLRRSGVGIP